MTVARRTIVFDETESSYHIVTRCVRRAYLCGTDRLSGASFEHRKGWVKTRLQELGGIFGVDICGYSVMSNHLHIVIRTRPNIWKGWSNMEVAKRWWQLFPRRRNNDGSPAEPKEEELAVISADQERLAVLRHRLGEVSWFMRCLNEWIARKANKEDDCKGRFWEGRYKCQALLDDASELACMAYVDLNPMRAGMAKALEECSFTSILQRLKVLRRPDPRRRPR